MPAALLARLRALWRGTTRASQLDAEMDAEMRAHVEMHAERLRERGLDAAEARRQAYVAFGGVEKWKEAGRDTRGTRWLEAIALDCWLGMRMLRAANSAARSVTRRYFSDRTPTKPRTQVSGPVWWMVSTRIGSGNWGPLMTWPSLGARVVGII